MPIWPIPRSIEEKAEATDAAVREFETFLREHRSQDRIRLCVRRKYADLCSCCGCEWEPDDDDGDGKKVPPYCAQCGAEIEQDFRAAVHCEAAPSPSPA